MKALWVLMIDLYLVFQYIKGCCHGNQLILGKCHERRLIHLHYRSKTSCNNRVRQLYKNISMLFLFPVIYGKLSTTFPIMLRLVFDNRKLPYKTTCINNTSITQPTWSFYLRETWKPVDFATFMQTVMITTILLVTRSSLIIE